MNLLADLQKAVVKWASAGRIEALTPFVEVRDQRHVHQQLDLCHYRTSNN